jgi:hypothetical protein
VPDSSVAWRLERDRRVVAELRPTQGGYLAVANGKPAGGFATIEEAVAAVPALRTLDAPGDWKLTTSLPEGVAGFMLDDPAEGSGEVEVNGTLWITQTTADYPGRQINDRNFLVPGYLPPDGVEEIDLLAVWLNAPNAINSCWSIRRYGPLCALFEPEPIDGPIWIREPDDLEACLELVSCIPREILVVRLGFSLPSGPALITRDQTGRATSGAGFSEADISLILSHVDVDAWGGYGGIVWVNDEMWREGHPAPAGLQKPLSGRPVRLFLEGAETIQHREERPPEHGWPNVHITNETRVFWLSGTLKNIAVEDSPKEWSWFALVSRDPDVSWLVSAANFTRSTAYTCDGSLFGVVIETGKSKPYLGFLLDDLEATLLYADAFGGVVIAGDDATLVEASRGGSVVRAWSWTSERVDPPAAADLLRYVD